MTELAAHPGSPVKLEKASRQVRHLAHFAIVEEAGMSAVSRLSVIIVSAVVVGFAVWAAFMKMDEVASTFGSVVPAKSVQVVQHLEGGIVRDILVQDRAMVEAGQVLVRLDPVQATAEMEQAESRRVGLMLKAERLRAFVEARKPDFGVVAEKYRGLAADQIDILRADSERWLSQANVLREQLSQKREEIAAASAQERSVREQLALVAEEAQMRETLYKAGHTSKVDYFAVLRQKAAIESEISRLQGQQRTAGKAIEELERRLADLDNNQRQDALKDLGTVTAELSQVEESVARLQDRVHRLDVVAPVRGYVQNLKAKTVGAVVPAGGQIMEIVPVDDDLLVETKINTRDVGHLAPGQKVIIKVASYDFVRYGSVPGTLKSVSATTYLDEKDNTPYYKGWVQMEHPWVGDQAAGNSVLPGMTVQADIVTGEKTLLQYLLKPIHASVAQAFHER
ncbi:MAG: HlyD family type I secretion periplasmic adaptor subunit [Magnetospirillum sp.]|nr:HlyD family type I secretion periplasmic adaptor subunit [Magnetospirillum sp.]